jgi:hemoglobin-like flavoprotein
MPSTAAMPEPSGCREGIDGELAGADGRTHDRDVAVTDMIDQDPSPADIARVHATFDRLWPTADDTAERFYAFLFEIAPQVRALFHGDPTEQRRKFMSTLAVLVGSLDDKDKLFSVARTLAEQHVHYGVEASHYPAVGTALMRALESRLGSEWNEETAAAWLRVYQSLSRHMIEQAYGGHEEGGTGHDPRARRDG